MERANSRKAVSVESFLGCAGFQGIIFVCLQLSSVVMISNILYMALGKLEPREWECHDDFTALNITPKMNESMKCAIIRQMGECKNFTSNDVFYSIVPQWQLVCNRDHYVYLIMSIQMLGSVLGASIFAQLSDSFGRKLAVMSSLILLATSGIASAFSPNWQVFCFLRFIVGIASVGLQITANVYYVEFLTKKHRLWFLNSCGLNPAVMVFVGIAYFIGEWKYLAIIPNIIGIPVFIMVWWIGESPRWLIQHGLMAEAEEQLRRINRINRTPFDDEELKLVLQNGKLRAIYKSPDKGDIASPTVALVYKPNPKIPKKKYSYWHLFSTRSLAIYTVVMSITHLSVGTVAGGLAFSADKLEGNIFVNLLLMYGVRWVVNIIVLLADLFIKPFGRRIGFIIPIFGICICSTAIVLAYAIWGSLHEVRKLITVLSTVIVAFCVPLWTMLPMSSAELFPTPIRNLAQGCTAIINRIGALILPYILYMAHFWRPAPFLVFAIISLIAGILIAIFIPETKGKPLPETMPERTVFRNCLSPKSCQASRNRD